MTIKLLSILTCILPIALLWMPIYAVQPNPAKPYWQDVQILKQIINFNI